jgi:hypothetical protein
MLLQHRGVEVDPLVVITHDPLRLACYLLGGEPGTTKL